jgi:hypothetical protein
MTFLSTVEAVFEISGRGCVIVPGVPPNDRIARNGSRIELRKPDGSILQTKIVALEIFARVEPSKKCYPILLPEGISKADVPIGTEVWICGTISN